MESTERLVQTWIATGREQEIDQTVLEISGGQSTLLNVVKALGQYLTSEEDILRTKGVDFLSQVISRCPPDKINRQAATVLLNFYTGKLEDEETVIPALKGLFSLTALPTFTAADAVTTTKALFHHIDMRNLVQSTRFLVFTVIDSLMARQRSALQGMNEEFLNGYIGLVDGEKDPRNLMLAFSIDRVICIEFDISNHIEEMFNITYCYFPIAFRPPPDDPYGITPDELKAALRSCLNASPAFGRLAVPLFLEKLLAGSPATKRDTLETLAICMPIYGANTAQSFAKKLWNSLKLEVFQPVNAEIESEALKTTQVLIQTLYDESVDVPEDLNSVRGLAKDICEECQELMAEPEKSQAVPATKMIASLLGTTPTITRFALSRSILHILKLFRDPGEAVHRPQILTLLCFIVSTIEARQSVILGDVGAQELLLSYKDEVLGAFISGLKVGDSREAALEGLRKLSQMSSVMTEEELVYIVHSIDELLLSDNNGSDDASDEALAVLILIAGGNSKIVEQNTLPLLFNSLPDSAPPRTAQSERLKYWRTLRWLTKLCVPAPLFETLVIRLSTKLELVYAPKAASGGNDDPEARAAYAHSILKTLSSVLEKKVDMEHADVPKYIDRLVPRLYSLFISQALSPDNRDAPSIDQRVLEAAGQIITLVLQSVTVERQRRFAENLGLAYFGGDVSKLAIGHQDIPSAVAFKPFESSSTTAQKDLVSLFAAATVAFHKEVFIPEQDPVGLLVTMQMWSLADASNDLQRTAAHHVVCALLNKNSDNLTAFIQHECDSFAPEELLDVSKEPTRRRTAIQSWLWIARALVVRNHESSMRFVAKLFDLIDDPSLGWDAACAVGLIASGGPEILSKRNHAVIRILYAQKYFKGVLPRILEGLRGPGGSSRQTMHVVALTSLVTALPRVVYLDELQTLMPFLLRGLDLPDVNIRASIIKTLLAVAEGGGEGPTTEHASTLLAEMLRNSLPQQTTSISLRVAALQYLGVLPKVVRYDVLHPHKAKVIRDLGRALDDPKRAVRKMAVEARTAWFTYDG